MTNRQPKHWVLVADSGQALILELQRRPYEFRLVSEQVSATQHQTKKELISDASGRVYSTKGAGGHAMAPRADPHDLAEEQFVRSLAKTLDKANRLGRELGVLTTYPAPAAPSPHEAKPGHVLQLIDAVLAQVEDVKQRLAIHERVEEQPIDPSRQPSHVLMTLLRASRELSKLIGSYVAWSTRW